MVDGYGTGQSDGDGVSRILVRSVTSYTDKYRDLQNFLTIDPSQYDVNLRFYTMSIQLF